MDNSNGELNGSPSAIADGSSNSTPFSVKDILNIDGNADPTGYINCHLDGWVTVGALLLSSATKWFVFLNFKTQKRFYRNSFPSHHAVPSNLYFNCDADQPPPPPPPPLPPYHDNYGITSSPNFHSQNLSHYHSYHNSMSSTGIIYDFEHNHNQSYYPMPVTAIDSFNHLANNNNSIGVKTNDSSGYYSTNGTFSHGYGVQMLTPIASDLVKTETESNHSQHLNSNCETSDSPVDSSNHSHCEYTPNHLDFNRNANQLNGPQSSKFTSNTEPICTGNMMDERFSSKFLEMEKNII